ncbi:MAG: hypothetical protein IPK85_01440 [Gemmatimonadetes bacterium]|nr:hypothetical protein [Gemmatimonadota bacterium]
MKTKIVERHGERFVVLVLECETDETVRVFRVAEVVEVSGTAQLCETCANCVLTLRDGSRVVVDDHVSDMSLGLWDVESCFGLPARAACANCGVPW